MVFVDVHGLPYSKLPDYVGELVAHGLHVGAEPDARPVLRTAVPRYLHADGELLREAPHDHTGERRSRRGA